MYNIEEEFKLAMQQSGIICPIPIIADGIIHRFNAGNTKNNNGWYVLYGHGGAYGDWSNGIHEKFRANTEHLTVSKQFQLNQQIKEKQFLEKQKQFQKHFLASKEAIGIIENSSDTGTSLYLKRKKINGNSIKYSFNNVIVPIQDIRGNIWNVQKIFENSKKLFLKGGRKKGCFHIIPSTKPSHKLFICEGYATGETIHMATGNTVIVAFDAYNISSVLSELRKIYSDITITIAADNDQYKEINTGKEKALLAANQFACDVILPEFSDLSSQPTDFNDLYVLEGLEHVRKQLTK